MVLLLAILAINFWKDRDLRISWNVCYGTDDPYQEKMDIFREAVNPTLVRPVIVFVHGEAGLRAARTIFRI